MGELTLALKPRSLAGDVVDLDTVKEAVGGLPQEKEKIKKERNEHEISVLSLAVLLCRMA